MRNGGRVALSRAIYISIRFWIAVSVDSTIFSNLRRSLALLDAVKERVAPAVAINDRKRIAYGTVR